MTEIIIMLVKCTQNVLHGMFDNVGNIKKKSKNYEFDNVDNMINLTKYTYFIVIMLVKCTLNVLHEKFINVGDIKNKVKITSLIMLVEFDIQYLTKYTYFIVIMLVKCTLNVLHGK